MLLPGVRKRSFLSPGSGRRTDHLSREQMESVGELNGQGKYKVNGIEP